MFRFDYKKLFYKNYSHKNINGLFHTVNLELEKISQWFKANKLSINTRN